MPCASRFSDGRWNTGGNPKLKTDPMGQVVKLGHYLSTNCEEVALASRRLQMTAQIVSAFPHRMQSSKVLSMITHIILSSSSGAPPADSDTLLRIGPPASCTLPSQIPPWRSSSSKIG